MKRASVILTATLFTVAACVASGENVIYDRGEYTLRGQLCVPEGPGPFPVVVFNHGGLGGLIGGATGEICAALANAGFIGFSPIRRPTRPLIGHIDDVMAAVDYAGALPKADPARLAIMGYSRGGILTYLAAVQRPEQFKAVVIMGSSVHHPRTVALADRLAAPVLILVAENDTGSRRTLGRNPLEGSRAMTELLKSKGKEVRLIVYPPFGADASPGPDVRR